MGERVDGGNTRHIRGSEWGKVNKMEGAGNVRKGMRREATAKRVRREEGKVMEAIICHCLPVGRVS